jgi:tetratricopeptide (TPR) repeat protein
MQLNLFGAAPPAELAEKARQAAERALALDPGCAEAYAQLGAISALYDWDWEESERRLRHAIELQPNYVNSHWLFANFCLAPQKRLDEALSEARRAVVVDPLCPLVHAMAGAVFWHRHEWDAALVELDEALHLEPSFIFALNIKSFVYISQGRLDLAASTTGRAWCRGYVQARLGNAPAARADLLKLVAKPTDPVAIAATYAGLGEEENALTWLEKCADAKVPQMVWLLDHAVFESLQGAPRYRAIRTRMHLP